jgi:hypothetical protein
MERLCLYEIQSLTLRELLELRVFEYRVINKMFGPTSEEVAGWRRKFYTEELHNLQSSPYVIFIYSIIMYFYSAKISVAQTNRDGELLAEVPRLIRLAPLITGSVHTEI